MPSTRNAVYPNNDDDQYEQQDLKLQFLRYGETTKQDPNVLGTMHTFKAGTPMENTYANGGPILGWDTCPVVLAAGCQSHRYYYKNTVNEDITITWLDGDMLEKIMSVIGQINNVADQELKKERAA